LLNSSLTPTAADAVFRASLRPPGASLPPSGEQLSYSGFEGAVTRLARARAGGGAPGSPHTPPPAAGEAGGARLSGGGEGRAEAEAEVRASLAAATVPMEEGRSTPLITPQQLLKRRH